MRFLVATGMIFEIGSMLELIILNEFFENYLRVKISFFIYLFSLILNF